MITLLSILLLCALLLVIRYRWMTYQVNRAIQKALGPSSIAKLKIQRDTVFRDCDSIRAAFSSSLNIRDYYVQWQTLEGDECISNVEAYFYPISGILHGINIHNAEL